MVVLVKELTLQLTQSLLKQNILNGTNRLVKLSVYFPTSPVTHTHMNDDGVGGVVCLLL